MELVNKIKYYFFKTEYGTLWTFNEFKILKKHIKYLTIVNGLNTIYFSIPFVKYIKSSYLTKVIDKGNISYKKTYKITDDFSFDEIFTTLNDNCFIDILCITKYKSVGFEFIDNVYGEKYMKKFWKDSLIPQSEVDDQLQVLKDEDIFKDIQVGYIHKEKDHFRKNYICSNRDESNIVGYLIGLKVNIDNYYMDDTKFPLNSNFLLKKELTSKEFELIGHVIDNFKSIYPEWICCLKTKYVYREVGAEKLRIQEEPVLFIYKDIATVKQTTKIEVDEFDNGRIKIANV